MKKTLKTLGLAIFVVLGTATFGCIFAMYTILIALFTAPVFNAIKTLVS
ncbi:MAG: hypothetical protein ABSG75_08310 [Syntrophales bacterium]